MVDKRWRDHESDYNSSWGENKYVSKTFIILLF